MGELVLAVHVIHVHLISPDSQAPTNEARARRRHDAQSGWRQSSYIAQITIAIR